MIFVHLTMFIREKPNKSGSTSIQIIEKRKGKYKVVKTLGSSKSKEGIQLLIYQAKHELNKIMQQGVLFDSEQDAMIEGYLTTLKSSNIRIIGPELVFGKIYDSIGFGELKEDLFRHLVISRLVFPLSKLKTVDYLYRYQGISLEISSIYRFMDKLSNQLKRPG